VSCFIRFSADQCLAPASSWSLLGESLKHLMTSETPSQTATRPPPRAACLLVRRFRKVALPHLREPINRHLLPVVVNPLGVVSAHGPKPVSPPFLLVPPLGPPHQAHRAIVLGRAHVAQDPLTDPFPTALSLVKWRVTTAAMSGEMSCGSTSSSKDRISTVASQLTRDVSC